MKKLMICLCFSFLTSALLAQTSYAKTTKSSIITVSEKNVLRFKISRPYCLLNFINTAYGRNGTSETLRDSIIKHTENDKTFNDLVQQFRQIPLDFSWKREEYPNNRRPYRSTYDLVMAAAVQADNIDDFMNRIAGVIPNSDLIKLGTILKNIDPYYEKIMWQPYGKLITDQIDSLQRFQKQAAYSFQKLKKFYNTSWSDDLPFTVAIYPIAAQPRQPTHTTATVHVNSLCVSVLTLERYYAGRMGVILHEIAHALYDEQSASYQHQLEGYFDKIKSPYTEGARTYLNEALATACGQGWVFKNMTGKMDTFSWYHDEYIEGFARALYPMVEKYIEQEKSIDEPFIVEAVRLFGVTFPRANEDIIKQMNRIHLYFNAEDAASRSKLQDHLFQFFNISSMSSNSPIIAPESIEDIRKTQQETLFFMVDKEADKTFKELKKVLPDLKKKKYDLKKDFALAYSDANNRLIIIIKSPLDKIHTGVQLLEKKRYLEKDGLYLTF